MFFKSFKMSLDLNIEAGKDGRLRLILPDTFGVFEANDECREGEGEDKRKGEVGR